MSIETDVSPFKLIEVQSSQKLDHEISNAVVSLHKDDFETADWPKTRYPEEAFET